MSTNTKPLLLLGGLGALGLLLVAAAAGSTDTAQSPWRQGMDRIDRVINRVALAYGSCCSGGRGRLWLQRQTLAEELQKERMPAPS